MATLAAAVSSQINANQELAYRIAWETAPHRLEERARNLRLAPITKWEAVAVPGLSRQLKAGRPGDSARTAPATTAVGSVGQGGNALDLIMAQFRTWVGQGIRVAASQPPL